MVAANIKRNMSYCKSVCLRPSVSVLLMKDIIRVLMLSLTLADLVMVKLSRPNINVLFFLFVRCENLSL